MGRYGELVKPADCKSVTLVVNIAGSSPARPTICSRIPTGRGIRLKPGSVRVQIPPGVRQYSYASVAELEYAAGSEPVTDESSML